MFIHLMDIENRDKHACHQHRSHPESSHQTWVSSPLGTQLGLACFMRTGLIISDDRWGVCEDLPIHREWQVILTQCFCLQKLCGERANCCLLELQSGRQTLQQKIAAACIPSLAGQECSNPPQGNFIFICQMRRTRGGRMLFKRVV